MGESMKYKIAIIILCGALLTSLIYMNTTSDDKNLLALGDGISLGLNAFNILSYDYNDYLKEYLEKNNTFKRYHHLNEVDETASSLLTKIENNISLNDLKIKQAIKEANVITINLGMDELNNYAKKHYLSNTKINDYLKKYEEIIKIISKLNNQKIFIIGLYETSLINNKKINQINGQLLTISQKYNCTFIDISDIKEHPEFYTFPNNYYINYKGHEYIFSKIESELSKNVSLIL